MNVTERLAALSGATVTVTGGFGLVGSRIVHKLRMLGATPLAVGRLDAYGSPLCPSVFNLSPADPDVIAGDITDAALMNYLVGRADYVIHAAALADVAECTRNPAAALQANIQGTQTVLDAAARHSSTLKRLVFVYSASVYGVGAGSTTEGARFNEDDLLRPASVYANTKLWGEHQTALTLGGTDNSHTVVRYLSVYGEPQVVKENSHSWVVARFAMRAALGLPLHLNGGGREVRDFVHVDDIADATLLAAVTDRADRATVNVGMARRTGSRDGAQGHSRRSGEQWVAGSTLGGKSGPSLRARGAAGPRHVPPPPPWDHPRGSGEQFEQDGKAKDTQGPSPRVRGA
ncbi:NAD-dependent epimerase/dehydratase family protein, partial [Streptomyces longwoodensis]|uniref:NAD-dependent epimerase/dehydratase family protein n=1 Tax=Streptomyces longwoodensis TaxID=68231 RepID=UPI0033CBA9C4